jgi:Arginase/agmatinase/formimionoglutamate hydrolase, arginase family
MKGSGISLLNFDGTLRHQSLLGKYPAEWIDFTDLRGCHGYCAEDSLRKIEHRLRSRKHRRITLIGRGNYHYVTWVLLSEIRQPFSLILFDHHTDLAPGVGDTPFISCGSWVSHALDTLPLLDRVVIVGAHIPDGGSGCGLPTNVTIIPEREARRMSPAEIVRAIRSATPGQPIYISVDKDVLDPENAATDWDQGSMTLRQLLDAIRELKRIRPLAGADVCGEMPLSPVDLLSGERVRHLKKNELANKAIVDTLLTG